jgi:autotransporter-associated beta strand protein
MLGRISIWIIAVAAAVFIPSAPAADGIWTNTASGGNWSAAVNWSNSIIADASGFTADFNSINIVTDPTVVHLDATRTIGNVIFGDTNTNSAASWLLDNNGSSANVLKLAGGTPTITVNTLASGKVATISATIAGTAGITKAGAGTLILSGANTNTGALTVSAGILKLGSANVFGDGTNNAASLVVSGSGILDLAGFSPTANPPLTLNSTASGFDVGAFYNSASTTSVYSGPITLSRQTRVGAGNILLASAISGGGNNFIKDGVNNLELTNSGTVTLGAFQANRGTLVVDSGTTLNVTAINVGSGNSVGSGLTLNGGAVNCSGFTQFGTGSGSASGSLTLNAGTLTVTNFAKGAVTFNVNFNGGTLRASASNPNFLTNASSLKIQSGGAVIDDAGYAIAITPPLVEDATSIGGGLVKNGTGTLTLAGTNTYTGATIIHSGVLVLNSNASIANSSTINILAGASLNVSAYSNNWLVSTGQTLAGNGAVVGGVTVLYGGTLQPGLGGTDISTLYFSNALTLAGSTVMTLNRTNIQNASSVAGVTTLTYGGGLSVSNAGPALQGGDTFTLFNATNYNGAFSYTVLPPLNLGLVWDTSQLPVNGSIAVWSGIASSNLLWGAPATIAGDSDVVANGGLLYAYNDANTATLVNGVAFAAGNSSSAFGSDVSMSGNSSFSPTAFGSGTGSPWSGLSSAYQTTLKGGAYTSNNGTQTVTLKNLLIGHPYLVQIWVNDNRSLASNRTETVTSSGGNTVTLDYNNTSANGGVGQYTIGTFTASATNQTFTLAGVLPAGGNSAQLNAIQVRDLFAPDGSTVGTISLNPATTYQTIHGIGANFCLGPQSIAWNNAQFNLAFSPTNLNISFVRLANSFECWLDESNIFWSGWDSDNVQFIKLYRAIQPNGLITMSAWSPPGRFKSTGSAMGGTLAKTNSVYRYADYADWWLRSLQYLRDNSTLSVTQAIPDFISIQNECDFTPSGTFYAAWQAGCYLSGTESGTKAGYPQALAAVKNSFQSNGFGFVKFIGPDTTTGGSSTIAGYLNNLPAGSLTAIAHHPYQGSVNDVGHNTSSLSGLRAAYPTNTIYMTEFFGDDSYGTNVPGWMMHALPMHNVFTIEQANTYLMWGLSLSPTSDTYCALGHYSKFIDPGDRRAQVTSDDPNVLVSLYRHTNSSPQVSDQLILVLINTSSNYAYSTIQTSAYWSADPLQRTWQVYKTANDGAAQQRLTLTENLAGTNLLGDRNLTLAPYSIATVLINSGVYSNAPPKFTYSASDRFINPGQTLLITNLATDANQPAQTLTYSMPVAPSNAVINAVNGILNWRPLISQAHAIYPFTVVVADNGIPSSSATQNFNVAVRSVTVPVASSPAMSNGRFSLSIAGAVGPDYTIQAATDLASPSSWTNLVTTNPGALPFIWVDTNTAGFTRRFYRTVLGP